MPASSPEQLRACLAEGGGSPSQHLYDDSLSAWFYDHCTLSELRTAFEGDADPQQCDRWHLSALEWRIQVEMAIIALEYSQR